MAERKNHGRSSREILSPEDRYHYEERLGILGVFNRQPTEDEHEIAMHSVRISRRLRGYVEPDA